MENMSVAVKETNVIFIEEKYLKTQTSSLENNILNQKEEEQ